MRLRPSVARSFALASALAALPASASAAEVTFEGYYRARARAYDSLSLNGDLANSEGLAIYAQHRLWLRPQIRINPHVAAYVDILALDGVLWGDAPAAVTDPVTGEDLPTEFSENLQAPTSDTDPNVSLKDITLWRAWGEIDTKIGRFKFGRMPLRWGVGIWQNDGLGWNGDYGDSADRVEWNDTIQDVFVGAAVGTVDENYVNTSDDTTTYSAEVGYKSERITTGIQTQFTHTGPFGTQDATSTAATDTPRQFSLFTVDAALDSHVGNIRLASEFCGHFGSGDLENGLNDVSVSSMGGVLDANLDIHPWSFGVLGGFATGDADTTDQKIKTFSFDRDYNLGIVLFEQPMPVLESTVGNDENLGRSNDVVLSGDSVSNALFVRPTAARELTDGLWVRASVLGAKPARATDLIQKTGRRSYGIEGDLSLDWQAWDHFDLKSTFGLFLPGSWYSKYSDTTYSGFNDPVYAGQVVGQVNF